VPPPIVAVLRLHHSSTFGVDGLHNSSASCASPPSSPFCAAGRDPVLRRRDPQTAPPQSASSWLFVTFNLHYNLKCKFVFRSRENAAIVWFLGLRKLKVSPVLLVKKGSTLGKWKDLELLNLWRCWQIHSIQNTILGNNHKL
jgi:hypothetical protein